MARATIKDKGIEIIDDGRPVVVIFEENNMSFAKAIVEAYSSAILKETSEVPSIIGYDKTLIDEFSSQIDEILAENACAVLFVGGAIDTGTFLQQIDKTAFDGQIYLTFWSSSSDLVGSAGTTIDGVTITSVMDTKDDAELIKSYYNEFEEAYNVGPSFSAFFYR